MNQRYFPQLGEQMSHQVLENGLNIFVFQKPEFQKGYAFFATNYGGMDMRFRLDGQWHETPAGVAHFLEHKMFDTESGNALQDLAENGASPNAFTSNDITGYYFESTEKFEENLRILLSFVSVPFFTKDSVNKEQGIIGQEIGMIEDDPDWNVYINLIRALYRTHPIRVSVAGSVQSIAEITHETLYACHKAFYNPANMVLCVAGDIDPVRVGEIAQEILPKQPACVADKDYGAPELPEVEQPLVEAHMEVSSPQFLLGYKGDAPEQGVEGLRIQLLADLALEALLGSSSPLYAALYQQGLINQSFSYGYESCVGCSFLIAGGESKDPAAVQKAIAHEAQRIAQEGIDEAFWQQLRKGVYGAKVRGLNSFENLCIGQAKAYFEGTDYLEFSKVYQQLDRKQAQQLIASWVTPKRTALSIVWPKGGE